LKDEGPEEQPLLGTFHEGFLEKGRKVMAVMERCGKKGQGDEEDEHRGGREEDTGVCRLHHIICVSLLCSFGTKVYATGWQG